MTPGIEAVADAVLNRLPAGADRHVVGISGGVAAGKSTLATCLQEALTSRGRRVALLCTDCFLLPNAVLAERGLTWRKGFPETFDAGALAQVLRAAKSGVGEVTVPVYSHEVYDVVPGGSERLPAFDLLVVEGVNVLQPPAVDLLDVAVYVDAPEPQVRGWFVERFLALCEAAEADATSFYRMFAGRPPEELRALAVSTWEAVNGPNLHEHILPSRARADLVVEKAADHAIVAVLEQFPSRSDL